MTLNETHEANDFFSRLLVHCCENRVPSICYKIFLYSRRDKEMWVEKLKNNVLALVGRLNESYPKMEGTTYPTINFSDIMPKVLNGSSANDNQILEKIRSYYPSCK